MKKQVSAHRSDPSNTRLRITKLFILSIFMITALVIYSASFRADAVQSQNYTGPRADVGSDASGTSAKSVGRPDTAQTDETDDAAIWGKRFPLHYELFKRPSISRGPVSAAVRRSRSPRKNLIRVRSSHSHVWRKIRDW